MTKSILQIIFAFFVTVILTTSCNTNDPGVTAFLKDIESSLEGPGGQIDLVDLAKFNWDTVCIFSYDDSPRDLTFRKFSEYVSSQGDGKPLQFLKSDNYNQILLFTLHEKPVSAIGFSSSRLSANGRDYELAIPHMYPFSDQMQSCHGRSELLIRVNSVPAKPDTRKVEILQEI